MIVSTPSKIEILLFATVQITKIPSKDLDSNADSSLFLLDIHNHDGSLENSDVYIAMFFLLIAVRMKNIIFVIENMLCATVLQHIEERYLGTKAPFTWDAIDPLRSILFRKVER